MKKLSIILIFSIMSLVGRSQFQSYYVSEIMAASSVLIEFPNGASGSGFILEDSPYICLVTARHVLYDAISSLRLRGDSVKITLYGRDISENAMRPIAINLKTASRDHVIFSDSSSDVAVILIGKKTRAVLFDYFSYVKKVGNKTISVVRVSDTEPYEKVHFGSEAFIFGYPTSLGLDLGQLQFNRPLLIRGVVAGRNEITRNLILNAQVYHGNSGGPVYAQYIPDEPFKVIGIVTELIPYTSDIYKVNNHTISVADTSQTVITNSNFSVISPIDNVLLLVSQIKRRFPF